MIGKGGGSIAAAFFCLIWYFVTLHPISPVLLVGITVIVCLTGIWSSWVVEKFWGKDSNKVVIDEFAGMCLSLVFIEPTISHIVAAFILFRFFDIYKPFYIRKTEKLPGGYGVMMDDILAGFYTNILLQVASRINLF